MKKKYLEVLHYDISKVNINDCKNNLLFPETENRNSRSHSHKTKLSDAQFYLYCLSIKNILTPN